nr:immunoglobulin light chain junction region [Macaca mulatta]MOV72836.1 immunoglobulin light chain junction region [Macaca mulatta]MOV72998.1 immunoglobulin light chain junction region [Macaca mulatta]MOV73371.1 immunoglobulin light chain junction region [Macaca mulatta]MOV73436.1 immunoglobulin light chain junction region [Macaca mulatta]
DYYCQVWDSSSAVLF